MLSYAILYLVLLTCIQKQSEARRGSGLESAEECRRVARDAKHNNQTLYTARCRLMSSETEINQFSLKNGIPPEWRWVLEHKSTVSGQVIVSDHDSVYMISQKQCIHRKKDFGRPARRLYYEHVEGRSLDYKIAWSGDFFKKEYHQNAYADCTKSTATWDKFSVNADDRTMENSNASQFIVFRNSLNAFEFNYTGQNIQEAFDEELKKIADNEMYRTSDHERLPHRNSPMILHKYPGSTGLSILASEDNILKGKHTKSNLNNLLENDPSFVAWSRAMEAKSARADKKSSRFNVDEAPELLEVIQLIIELFAATGFTIQAYKSAMSIRPLGNTIFSYNEDSWEIVRDQADFGFQGDWYKTSHDLLYEFGGALAALIFGFKTVYDSNLWRKTRLLVTQGGLITYGEECEIGTLFYVSHWYSVEVLNEGNIVINRIVLGIVIFLTFGLLCSMYFFSISRQAKLHLPFIQGFVRIVHEPIETALTILARCFPDHWIVLNSYEKDFKNNCDRLCKKYFRTAITRKHTSKLLGRLELEAQKEKDKSIFWRRWYGAPSDNVTRNDIEKASEILAADRHGRLSYFQALAIMFDANLTEVADRFNRDSNCHLSAQEIKHLAMVYYIEGLIVPCNRGNGFPLNSFRRVSTSDGIDQHAENTTALAPIIQGGRNKEYAVIERAGEEINDS